MIYHYYAERGGWRLVVLYQQGRKWAYFLELSTFDKYRIPLRDIARLRPRDLNPKRVARRMARRRAFLSKCGLTLPNKTIATAIAALKAAKP